MERCLILLIKTKMSKLIGILLVGSPFILLFIAIAVKEGLINALLVFGLVAFVGAMMTLGFYLLSQN
jgi:hypothetical protein